MFCFKCGENLPDEADFCIKCGSKMPAKEGGNTVEQPIIEIPPQQNHVPQVEEHEPMRKEVFQSKERNVLDLVGKNKEYYAKAFEKVQKGQITFNFAAWLFSTLLFSYRKCDNKKAATPFLLLILSVFLEIIVFVIIAVVIPEIPEFVQTGFSYLIGFAFTLFALSFVQHGFTFNQKYYEHLTETLQEAEKMPYDEGQMYLAEKTGTSSDGLYYLQGRANTFLPVLNLFFYLFAFTYIYDALGADDTADSPSDSLSESSYMQEATVPSQSENGGVEDEPITFEETMSDIEQDLMTGEEEKNLFVDNQQNRADNVKNYDFSQASSVFQDLEIPDFIAFATDGKNSTDPYFMLERSAPNTYGHHFPESYQNSHRDYIEYLKELGFIAVIDGYEGYYSLEKTVDEKKITISTFIEYHADTNSGQVNIQVEYPQHEIQDSQLSSDEIEPQITIIREIYNDTVSKVSNGTCLERNIDTGVLSCFDGSYQNLCYVQVSKGYNDYPYSRHYYYHENELVFAFFESSDSHRLYFYHENLFRWRYTDTSGNAVNYEYENSQQYQELEGFALKESSELRSRAIQW